jgi:hypothetical protein
VVVWNKCYNQAENLNFRGSGTVPWNLDADQDRLRGLIGVLPSPFHCMQVRSVLTVIRMLPEVLTNPSRRSSQVLPLNFSRTRLKQTSRVRGLATQTSGLAGTAPYHNLYVFLHSTDPPQSFPPVVSSPLQKALQLKLAPFRGLVNFSWDPSQRLAKPHSETESYSATAFSKGGGPLKIEQITLSNFNRVIGEVTAQLPTGIPQNDTTYLYVCTHGARDCRCGDTGGKVATALREEISQRGLSSTVKLGETGHVGGHQSVLLTFLTSSC